jgi:hypothetical protein
LANTTPNCIGSPWAAVPWARVGARSDDVASDRVAALGRAPGRCPDPSEHPPEVPPRRA